MDERVPICVTDLGFGDCGKGTIVDYICSPASTFPDVDLVVRYHSGPQAGHNVNTPDGREHTFSMFGSGTFHRVPTYLSEYVFINPYNIVAEAEHLAEIGVHRPFDLLWIDKFCPIITPYHKAANQLREKRRDNKHGSCGQGFGETVQQWLQQPSSTMYAKDLTDRDTVRAKLLKVRGWLYNEFGYNADRGLPSIDRITDYYMTFGNVMAGQITDPERRLNPVLETGQVVFEGAQGVLLDEWFGFHPYTTWSTCTPRNATHLLERSGRSRLHTIGVVRTHMTRHGAGPFPTESARLTAALPDPSNKYGTWQGKFRVGYFDAVLHQYAISCCGGGPERIESLAITHLDRMEPLEGKICTGYQSPAGQEVHLNAIPVSANEQEQLSRQAALTEWLGTITPIYKTVHNLHPWRFANALDLPVEILSRGPTYEDKEYVRQTSDYRYGALRTDLRSSLV